MTHKALAVHGHLLSPQKTFKISGFSIAEPGFAFHSRFHILLDEKTTIEEVSVRFVDRVFNLQCPSDLPTYEIYGGNIFGTIFCLLTIICK